MALKVKIVKASIIPTPLRREGYIFVCDGITKVRSRQRVEPAAVQPVVRLTRHWRDFGNRILGLGRRSRNNKSSQGSCFIAKQRSDIKENLSASQAC